MSQPLPSRKFPVIPLVLVGLGCLFVSFGLLVFFQSADLFKALASPTAPDFTMQTLAGNAYSLGDYRGQVVLVNFWASWCGPCIAEAEDIQRAFEFYRARGEVVFLGVNIIETDSAADVKQYLQDYGITYPNGLDYGSDITDAYRITGYPTTIIIDPDGKIVFTKSGAFQSVAEIQSVIDPYLR